MHQYSTRKTVNANSFMMKPINKDDDNFTIIEIKSRSTCSALKVQLKNVNFLPCPQQKSLNCWHCNILRVEKLSKNIFSSWKLN